MTEATTNRTAIVRLGFALLVMALLVAMGIVFAAPQQAQADEPSPTFTVTFDDQNSESYPIYLMAAPSHGVASPLGGYTYPDAEFTQITGPGTYTIELSNPLVGQYGGTPTLYYSVCKDASAIQTDYSWSETNFASTYNANITGVYWLSGLSTDPETGGVIAPDGSALSLNMAHQSGFVTPTLTVEVDEEDVSRFPAYIKLELKHDAISSTSRQIDLFTVVQIDGPGTYNVALGGVVPAASNYEMRVGVYSDASCNNTYFIKNWYSPECRASSLPYVPSITVSQNGVMKKSSRDLKLSFLYDPDYYYPTIRIETDSRNVGSYPVYLYCYTRTDDPHYSSSTTGGITVAIYEDGVHEFELTELKHGWTKDEAGTSGARIGVVRYWLRSSPNSTNPAKYWKFDDVGYEFGTSGYERPIYISSENNGAICAPGSDQPLVLKAYAQKDQVWTRLWGDTALDTTLKIVQEGWKPNETSTVIIATMGGYHDALAAAPLAGTNKAPILLTAKKTLSPQTREAISYLNASKAIIVGGPAAVSEDTEAQLVSLLGRSNVTRVDGADAQETAVKIAQATKDSYYGIGPSCIVATSKSYHDALAIAPWAYQQRDPIYLTRANGLLRDDVAEAIRTSGCTGAIIVGGTAAIPESTEQQLKDMGLNVRRLDGADAIETSAVIADYCVRTTVFTADGMGVATSGGYHDALAGAALCGKTNSPLILINKKGTNTVGIERVVTPNRSVINRGYVFGGESALTAAVVEALEAATS